MVYFDTLKFSIPYENIRINNYSHFDTVTRDKDNICIISRKSIFNQKVTGLKSIIIDYIKRLVYFELSAKILLEKYKNGIHYLNFMDILETINNFGSVTIDIKNCYDKIIFYRLDLSKNISVNHPIFEYILSIDFLINHQNIFSTNYKNNSIVLVKNPLSKKNRLRLVFYDKYAELSRHKKENNFCDIEMFKNCLRFECNIVSFVNARTIFNLPAGQAVGTKQLNQFTSESYENVFNIFFDNNIKSSALTSLGIESLPLNQILRNEGIISIYKALDCNINRVVSFVRSKVKGNISKYIKDVQYVINQFNSSESTSIYSDRLSEIRKKLVA